MFRGACCFRRGLIRDLASEDKVFRDQGQFEKRRQQQTRPNRIGQRKFLNAAWNVEMTGRNQFHLHRVRRQHPDHSKQGDAANLA